MLGDVLLKYRFYTLIANALILTLNEGFDVFTLKAGTVLLISSSWQSPPVPIVASACEKRPNELNTGK